jgi:uncharacterized protein (TIGR02391 family)
MIVGRRVLDQGIMSKLARKLGKPVVAINVIVSKLASKQGISSEAALVVLAKKNGIGAAVYQRKLDPSKQAEVRESISAVAGPRIKKGNAVQVARLAVGHATTSPPLSLRLAIEYLIQDPVLLNRCRDILLAAANYDRPINQATQILEDRIRTKSQPPKRLTGENLVGFAFNEDIAKTVLRVASNDPDDQRGLTQLLRGIVPAFRNVTHHRIVNSFSRAEAISVCGFVDVLLRAVDSSVKVK